MYFNDLQCQCVFLVVYFMDLQWKRGSLHGNEALLKEQEKRKETEAKMEDGSRPVSVFFEGIFAV